MIDDTNAVANYSRHRTRNIRAAIRSLSSEQKQHLLDEIRLRRGICSLTEQSYNHQECKYIESLLEKK